MIQSVANDPLYCWRPNIGLITLTNLHHIHAEKESNLRRFEWWQSRGKVRERLPVFLIRPALDLLKFL